MGNTELQNPSRTQAIGTSSDGGGAGEEPGHGDGVTQNTSKDSLR